MEIRSTRSFIAIPATLIRGVFNSYLNLLCKMCCKYFIYSFIFYLFIYLLFSFNHCNFLFICGKFTLACFGLQNTFQRFYQRRVQGSSPNFRIEFVQGSRSIIRY